MMKSEKGDGFMKSLQKNKVLQALMGFVSILLVLWSGMFIINKIGLIETQGVVPLKKATSIIYSVIFCVFVFLVSLFSKKNRMNWLYYSVFIVSFVSNLSSYIMYHLDGSTGALIFGIVLIPLGKPFIDITKGLEKLLEYTTEYNEKTSFLWQSDFLILFLCAIIFSLIIYQYPTKKEKSKFVKWEIPYSTKLMAKVMIGVFGIYAFLADICLNTYGIVSDILAMVLCPVALFLTMTFIAYILPIGLCVALIVMGITQAVEEKNFRMIINPYIIAAVVSTLAGAKRILDVAMLCF